MVGHGYLLSQDIARLAVAELDGGSIHCQRFPAELGEGRAWATVQDHAGAEHRREHDRQDEGLLSAFDGGRFQFTGVETRSEEAEQNEQADVDAEGRPRAGLDGPEATARRLTDEAELGADAGEKGEGEYRQKPRDGPVDAEEQC